MAKAATLLGGTPADGTATPARATPAAALTTTAGNAATFDRLAKGGRTNVWANTRRFGSATRNSIGLIADQILSHPLSHLDARLPV